MRFANMTMRNTFCAAVALLCAFTHFAKQADAQDDKFAEQMEQFLKDDENVAQIGQALERYFLKRREEQRQQQAKAEANRVEEQFANPVDIKVGNAPVKGPESAPITIIEFSDFQCPYCKRAAMTMEEVLKAYPDKVKLAFMHLPLPFHTEAKPAAIAALAAQQQGKFWEMHDKLFENQNRLGNELYLESAKAIGLDMEKFKKDLEDPKLAAMVDADAKLGQQHGVRGTPGFFVNGVQVSGARGFDYFKDLIDRWANKEKEKEGAQ